MKVIVLQNKCKLDEIVNKNTGGKYEEIPIPKEQTKKPGVITDLDFDFMSVPFNPKPILSPEEVKEKRKLIIHIKNYLREFSNSLSEFKNIDYTNKTIQELSNYLDEIKLTVCHSNSGGLLVGVFHGACDILEATAPIINYDLTGLKYIASKNPNILNSVKELSLDYQNLNYIPPEKRLALLMFQMCYALNTMNKSNKKIDKKLDNLVSEDLKQKYVEL